MNLTQLQISIYLQTDFGNGPLVFIKTLFTENMLFIQMLDSSLTAIDSLSANRTYNFQSCREIQRFKSGYLESYMNGLCLRRDFIL